MYFCIFKYVVCFCNDRYKIQHNYIITTVNKKKSCFEPMGLDFACIE